MKGAGKAQGALVSGRTLHISTLTVPRTEHQASNFKFSGFFSLIVFMKYFATLKRENQHYKCKVKRSLLYLSNYTNLFQSIKTQKVAMHFFQLRQQIQCDRQSLHVTVVHIQFTEMISSCFLSKVDYREYSTSLIQITDFCIPKPKNFTWWWQRPMDLWAVSVAVLPHYNVHSILA